MFNGVNDEIIILLDEFKERFENFLKEDDDIGYKVLYFYLIKEMLNFILKIIEYFNLLLDNE